MKDWVFLKGIMDIFKSVSFPGSRLRPCPWATSSWTSGTASSTCFNRVREDRSKGIFDHPEYYENLNPQSSFKHYQLREYLVSRDDSARPVPCGPGSCDMLIEVQRL